MQNIIPKVLNTTDEEMYREEGIHNRFLMYVLVPRAFCTRGENIIFKAVLTSDNSDTHILLGSHFNHTYNRLSCENARTTFDRTKRIFPSSRRISVDMYQIYILHVMTKLAPILVNKSHFISSHNFFIARPPT